jgi:hypothetical protein
VEVSPAGPVLRNVQNIYPSRLPYKHIQIKKKKRKTVIFPGFFMSDKFSFSEQQNNVHRVLERKVVDENIYTREGRCYRKVRSSQLIIRIACH